MIDSRELRARLDRQRPPPAPAEAPAKPELAALIARIERLRARPRPTPPRDLANLLDGETIAPGLVRIDRLHAAALPCGRRHLGDWIAAAGGATAGLLLLDTETSGLAGGSGSIAWMIGIARIDGATLRTRQFVISGFGAEAAMLMALHSELATATGIVSFNGKSFDLPLLASRCILNRRPPLPVRPHLDLLHGLRRRYRRQLPNCRQATLEAHVLGSDRRADLPGSAAPALWQGLLAGRVDADGIAGMARHNRLDLVGMAALLHAADPG